MKTLGETYFLNITWQIDDMRIRNLNKPWRILEIISREYENSPLSILKSRGWLSSISTSFDNEIPGFSFVLIDVVLTKKGFSHYLEAVEIIFEFIHSLKSSNSLERIMKELNLLGDIRFEYSHRVDPLPSVKALASNMHQYSPNHILKGPHLAYYNEWAMADFLGQLSVDNLRIMLASQDHIENPEIERWFETEYSVKSLSQDFLTKLSSLGASNWLFLPPPNRFIPTNLSIKDLPFSKYPSVSVLVSNPSAKLWYMPDDMVGKPIGEFTFSLYIPLLESSNQTYITSQIFLKFAIAYLQKIKTEASLANLSYSINGGFSRINFSFFGYSDKLPELIQEVIRGIVSFTADHQRLKAIKKEL